MSISVVRRDRVLVVTLNRPEARNALSLAMRDELEECLLTFDRDAGLAVAVLTGAGEAFCAGADLKDQRALARASSAALDPGDRPLVRDLDIDKPVIAAVNGMAVGGGFELALICDIRIASTQASFGLPEVRIGSMPGSGGTQRLPRIAGLGNAMSIALTGDRLSAEDALRMGIVSRVCPPEELLDTASAIAQRIAENAPLSVRAVRKAIRKGSDLPLAKGLSLERLLFTTLRDTEDRAEGRNAFRENRRPNFKGR